MEVTFAHFGEEVASSRLRATIPQAELAKMGIGKGRDVLIYGKHFVEEHQLEPFKKRIYDVCDDHFDHETLGKYYRRHVEMADIVTCNSETMQAIIKAKTGRYAFVIHEPYEHEEQAPAIEPRLLWYGHKSNLCDIERLKPDLRHPLLIMTNQTGYPQWSSTAFKNAMDMNPIVVIPTGKSMAKSENRMVEAIRCGRYVCAEYLPAYVPFTSFFDLGNIPNQIDVVLANPLAAMAKIKDAQGFIRERYSPATVAGKWLEVIQRCR